MGVTLVKTNVHMTTLYIVPTELVIVLIVLAILATIAFIVFTKRSARKNAMYDLDEDEIPIIKLGVKEKDLGPGTSEDHFRAYMIKYIEGDPLIKRRILLSKDEDVCIRHIASIQHNLRLSFVFETGENLFIDDVQRFCRSVYDKLKEEASW